MKNYFKGTLVLTLTLFFFSQGFGQTATNSNSDSKTAVSTVQCKFVDSNNNGICDNHEMKGTASQCANFVDKDGNGICDNCPKNANAGLNATCSGHQNGAGKGQGMANCCGRGPCAGKGQGKCCANQQGTQSVTPAETPDPKK
jgi:hypothetical protein